MPETLPLDPFISEPDVRERFTTEVRAPADLVMAVASEFDLQSLRVARALFWLRGKLMGAKATSRRKPKGLLAETLGLGWGMLVNRPPERILCGAHCRPWQADVVFSAIAPDQFAGWNEPDQVKIAWSLETEPLGPERTLFAHETRVVATDEGARRKFRRYWRWARFGIIGIRLLLMPAIRRQAERRFRAQRTAAARA
ncbi:MAG TPA: hypothetical protein PK413_02425 [Thermoanaerobaculia bacterium]|nr:hypothetical protein [Thermoanaerobaculia bacterium]